MSIVVLKMSNGDEVIGKEVGEYADVVLDRPRSLQMMQSQHGVQAGLIPYIIAAPEMAVAFNSKHIICKVSAPTDISNAYLQQTSGIQLASTLLS